MEKILGLFCVLCFSFSLQVFAVYDFDHNSTLDYTWTVATGPVVGYNIYVAVDGVGYIKVGTTITNSCAILNCAGYSYFVKVAAYDINGNEGLVSDISNECLRVGDVDGNGVVNSYDASMVSQHVLRKIVLSVPKQRVGDVDGNGVLTSYDAALISQYVLKKISTFPIEVLRAPKIRIVPVVSDVGQNYPNPFNPDTWIPYQLKEDSEVIIRIYKTTGEFVRKLDIGFRPAGFYIKKNGWFGAAYWDGKDLSGEPVASGVYFYNVQAGKFIATKKMVVMK